MRIIPSAVVAAALTLSFGASAVALDHHGDKKQKMKDPMARAEMQCDNARKAAAEGSDADKAGAEEKCAKAMEKSKKKAENKALKAEKKAMKDKEKAEKMKKEKKAKKDEKDEDDIDTK